ncbi:unnamed protein product [Vicia faba]|uniref:Uncharacterized protein n=1 Tax=Vicia faba TaxID=3906 RepID=A0AAV0YT48_VICFA|nr:unnamed protein product [Vicia faba]
MGARWMIGNERKVDILKDNWLSSVSGFKVMGPVRGIEQGAIVSDLIDSDLRCWNQELISDCLGPVTCSHICSIPLSWSNLEDSIIWHFEKDGMFSVKSTYHLLRKNVMLLSQGPLVIPGKSYGR